MPRKYTNFIDGFWQKVEKADSCWLWHGARRGGRMNQYGNYRGLMAHRVAWELANKVEVPCGLYVLHKCDNPQCVRHDHLFLGTIKDNAADMMRKRRRPTKLSWELAAEIRDRYSAGEKCSVIADSMGILRSSVTLIIKGRQWKDNAVSL